MRITASTHPGCKLEENQDYYRAGRLGDDTYWLVLCDGMGGAAAGGLASEIAALYIQETIERRVPDLLTDAAVEAFLLETAAACNERIFAESRKAVPSVTMGTTMVAAVIRRNLVQMVHAGDSRMYVLQKNAIKQITTDHSIVQELLDSGRISPEQAYSHPNKNIITSALGVDTVTRIDYNEHKLGHGDMLLCCSDGLSNMLHDQTIASVLRETDFYESAERLVHEAVAAGGFDNITAIVVEVD